MVWQDGGMARWSGEIGSWKVAPLLSLTNSHTIGGTEGISPIIISYTMQYTLQQSERVSSSSLADSWW